MTAESSTLKYMEIGEGRREEMGKQYVSAHKMAQMAIKKGLSTLDIYNNVPEVTAQKMNTTNPKYPESYRRPSNGLLRKMYPNRFDRICRFAQWADGDFELYSMYRAMRSFLAEPSRHGTTSEWQSSDKVTAFVAGMETFVPEKNIVMINIACRENTDDRICLLNEAALTSGKNFSCVERDTTEAERAKSYGIAVTVGDALNPPEPAPNTCGFINFGGQNDQLSALGSNVVFKKFSRLIVPISAGTEKARNTILKRIESYGFEIQDIWRKDHKLFHLVTVTPK